LADGELSAPAPMSSQTDHLLFSQNASIKSNIVSFSELDPELYSSVIYACDLDTDLEVLPMGDATVIGSKGFSLSGGQKQRIVGLLTATLTCKC
jgi:ABC-type bacteriocin/lantibiotic exporter with double-glycine peptidase domain